ncbi:MAG: undecaprenyl-diphosphate phosphatase [Christensenellales bacterium]
MSILAAVVLGLVQGLCEFLPVSSSGHLLLLQDAFGLTEGALGQSAMAFDIMLHLGSLLAVFLLFRKDVAELIRHPLGKKMRYLIVATLPIVIVVILLGDRIDELFQGKYLGLSFLLTAVLLSLSELGSKRRTKEKKNIGLPQVLGMGLMQAVGVLPGVSRSGATISGGLMTGLSRSRAAKFSFLMSIPAILGSAVMAGKDIVQDGLGEVSWGIMLIAMATAFVSGFFAIRFMLKLLKKYRLYGFALYVLLLGIATLIGQGWLEATVMICGFLVLVSMAIVEFINKRVVD